MNRLKICILAITIILLTIFGTAMWTSEDTKEQEQDMNKTIYNNTTQNSNVIPLEKPPFLKEVKP